MMLILEDEDGETVAVCAERIAVILPTAFVVDAGPLAELHLLGEPEPVLVIGEVEQLAQRINDSRPRSFK